jgi:outer membrane murein-binding lipoprotein Lpp
MEEIKIKALIDAADSAKTIQELKKALKDLKSAAVEAGEGSEAFNRITAAAGQVSDRVGDLNAQVNALGDDLGKLRGVTQIAQGIAGGFATAQGALALFGSENAALEESLLKVNGAMSMLNGIMAIGEVLQKQSLPLDV